MDFLAILEPRISGPRADEAIRRTGLVEVAPIEAVFFSGSSGVCGVHPVPQFKFYPFLNFAFIFVLTPLSQLAGFSLLFMLARSALREAVWQELLGFGDSIEGPWCVGGDFNQVLYSHEKPGGALVNEATCASFTHCVNTYHLIDLGFYGQPFTWKRGEPKQRIDRDLCNADWQAHEC